MCTSMMRPWKLSALCLMAAATLYLSGVGLAGAQAESLPLSQELLDQWHSRMTTFGKQHCDTLTSGLGTIDNVNFDAEHVYYQMANADLMNQTLWRLCANQAEKIYRDNFVVPANGDVQGDLVFTQGLKSDYLSGTKDDASLDAVLKLAQNSFWASSSTSLAWTQSYETSREVAQALIAYVDAMALSGTKPSKYDGFVTQALGHIDQWFVQNLWQEDGAVPLSPRHVGMTLQALIYAHNAQADSRIPDKIKLALDGLWNIAWRANEQAFYYDSQSPFSGDPNYNLLIAPAYAWYYRYTVDAGSEDSVYRDRGDQIFAGGVKGASLEFPWEFNRNYMWSFRYVTWRQVAPAPDSTPAPPANQPPVCEKAQATPSKLWPPNHKLVAVGIAGITDPDGDPISLEMTVRQNEPDRGLGRRDLTPDVMSQAGTLYLRAERSGHGSGREYLITVKAEDGRGGLCETTVKVTVPHHKSKMDRYDDDDDDDDDRGKRDSKKDGDRHGDKDKDKDRRHDGDKRGH
jgi:hypothetical protein